MTKKITLTLLVGIFIFAFNMSATAQKKTNSTTVEEVTPVTEKQKRVEQYNPRPQEVQNKASKNSIRQRSLEEEIRDLKSVIARLEAKTERLPFEEKRLAQLKQDLALKEKALKG